VLEIGAGTGEQANALAALGHDVQAIDLPASDYRAHQTFPVQTYDGHTIPFDDASFDVVFSSNVLEHVRDLQRMNSEVLRVLRPGGFAIHVLPTPAWRLWTTLTAFPAGFKRAYLAAREPGTGMSRRLRRVLFGIASTIVQRRHGERGNLLSEPYYFRPAWWRDQFVRDGMAVTSSAPLHLFYTGNMLLGSRLSLRRRESLSRYLGSATWVYTLTPLREISESDEH
jgi:SAM-dependent methyltransferase